MRRARLLRSVLVCTIASIALALAGCGGGSASHATGFLYDYNGFTTWSCDKPRPRWFVAEIAFTSQTQFRGTVAHEQGHERLMIAFGCEGWHEWIAAHPANRVLAEAIAYCAQVRQQIQDGAVPGVAVREIVHDLATYHLPLLGESPELYPDTAQAKRLLAGVCGP